MFLNDAAGFLTGVEERLFERFGVIHDKATVGGDCEEPDFETELDGEEGEGGEC